MRTRLHELEVIQRQRGLSQAEWYEVAALLGQVGRQADAAKALGRAAAAGAAGLSTPPPIPPRPTIPQLTPVGSASMPWGGLGCGGWLLVLLMCSPFLLMGGCAWWLFSPSPASSPTHERHGPTVAEVQTVLNQWLPGFNARMKDTGGWVEAKVDDDASADFWVHVPGVMPEVEAKEVAYATANNCPLPHGTTFAVRVVSPAGQYLATVVDQRL